MPAHSRLYELLEVAPDASEAEIRKAYRRLALKHHPDRGGSTEKFQELSAAHEILADPAKRQIYDSRGEEGLRQASQGSDVFSSSMPAADVFGEIFGGFFKDFNGMFGDSPYSTGSARPRRSRPRKPEAVSFEITASLEELFIGTVRHVKINRTVLCQPCAGSGSTRPGAEVICPDCRGRAFR